MAELPNPACVADVPRRLEASVANDEVGANFVHEAYDELKSWLPARSNETNTAGEGKALGEGKVDAGYIAGDPGGFCIFDPSVKSEKTTPAADRPVESPEQLTDGPPIDNIPGTTYDVDMSNAKVGLWPDFHKGKDWKEQFVTRLSALKDQDVTHIGLECIPNDPETRAKLNEYMSEDYKNSGRTDIEEYLHKRIAHTDDQELKAKTMEIIKAVRDSGTGIRVIGIEPPRNSSENRDATWMETIESEFSRPHATDPVGKVVVFSEASHVLPLDKFGPLPEGFPEHLKRKFRYHLENQSEPKDSPGYVAWKEIKSIPDEALLKIGSGNKAS